MKEKKSKKSEISMQNNELFEGRKKRETGYQAQLGKYSGAGFKKRLGVGLETAWVVVISVDLGSESGCTQSFSQELGPGK